MKKRTNETWLRDLRGTKRDEAIKDLRKIIVRGLGYTLSKRGREDVNSLSEDFAQEALIKILDNLDSFRGESKFTTWAQKIAINVAFSELRRLRWRDISLQDFSAKHKDAGDFTPTILTDPAPNPEEQTMQQGMMEMVQRMIEEELTDRQRTAMMAVMKDGMPLAEVARRMGSNRNALYKLLHDARSRLKNRMLAEGMTLEKILAAFDV